MTAIRDNNKLKIFLEARKRKIFVGVLEFTNNNFTFLYDRKYLKSDSSIPLGPDIPLKKVKHTHKKQLFPSFLDRIPSRKNPAYKDYCNQEGISINEENPIILLGTIGKRGPSSFIFELIHHNNFNVQERLSSFRSTTGISLQDTALAFGLNYVTVQRIEKGTSTDSNVLKLIQIYLEYPNCLRDQLQLTSCYLHHKTMKILFEYINELESKNKVSIDNEA